jgi:arylsulfatase A-like enzyme
MSPYSDELLTDLAVALLSDADLRLGRRGAPDVLCVAFSALDHIAHRYGPESRESLDVLARLDAQIGRLLDAVGTAAPRKQVIVALSTDHGFLPLGDVRRISSGDRSGGAPRVRLFEGEFTTALNRRLDADLCLDPARRPVLATSSWNLYYDRSVFPLRSVEGSCGPAGRAITTREVDAALPGAIAATFGDSIERVLLASERSRWPALDPAVEFARNAFHPVRSGDAILFPRSGEVMHWDSRGRGTNHGSHHEYDVDVPLILWGGEFAHANAKEPTTPYDLAPTLAGVLGVPLPDAVGRRLSAPGR